MCGWVILENGGTLTFVSDCCKNQKMCGKFVYNYPYSLEFDPDYF